jgi:hypothetical protein
LTVARRGERRTRSLPRRIQAELARLYGVEAPDVDDFVQPQPAGREVVLVREHDGELEIAVHLPEAVLEDEAPSLNGLCQIAEGVSHFMYLAERARRGLPTTWLELELQAEIDKYALLARLGGGGFDRARAALLRERLFVHVAFTDPPGSEHGERYRVANHVGARFAEKLEQLASRGGQVLRALRDFYGAGQREKLEIALAA